MKIYVDLVLLLNFLLDFLLLLSVSVVLKRGTKIFNMMIGAFIGSLSTLLMFYSMSSVSLFFYKVVLSIVMCISTFGFKSIKYTLNNLLFLYLSSIVLGGGLYFINNQISLKNSNFIFVNNGFSINLIILVIFSPIVVYIYIKKLNRVKDNYSNYYNIKLYINDVIYNLNAYLDTGNVLKDPYKNRPVLIVSSDVFKIEFDHFLFVPYKTIDKEGMMKCIKADKLIIENVGVRYNFLVGLLDERLEFDGVNSIIGKNLLEGIWD